jgi:hypothetical protein
MAIGALLLSSCSSRSKALDVIPEETAMVWSINIPSLTEKGKLNDLSNFKLAKKLKREFKDEDRDLYKEVNKVIEDPSLSGLDVNSDGFMYWVYDSKSEYMCMSMAMSDANVFEKFVEDMIDETDADLDIEKESNYKYIAMRKRNDSYGDDPKTWYKYAIAWDNNKAIWVGSIKWRSDAVDAIDEFMTLDEDDKITKDKAFMDFYSNKKDLSVWLSTNMIKYEEKRDFKWAEKTFDLDFEDNIMYGHLDFGNDYVSVTANANMNEELSEFYMENKVWDNQLNKDLFDFLPEQSLVAASTSLNPEVFYSFFSQVEDFDRFERKFEREFGIGFKKATRSATGNVVASLYDVKEVEYTYISYESEYNPQKEQYYDYYTNSYQWRDGYDYKEVEKTKETPLPIFAVVAETNNDKLMDAIVEAAGDDIEKEKGYYTFKMDRKYPGYMAYNEQYCIITNDEDCVKKFKDGGYGDNFGGNSWSSDLAAYQVSARATLELKDYPKDIKNQLQVIKSVDEFLESVEVSVSNNNEVEFKLHTHSNGDNTLFTILKMLDDQASALMRWF